MDGSPGRFPATRERSVRRPGHDPYLLDGGADGAVLAPRCGARGVPSGSADRAGGAELGVLAPVRGAALDLVARRGGAPARASTPADTVSRPADARLRAADRRAR